jgi:hypothetical protein
MTQVSQAPERTRAQIPDRTLRKDNWRRAPIITATLLTIWVAYATVRVFMGHWSASRTPPTAARRGSR